MWDSPAKALARNFFYQDFLPSELPMRLLRNGNFLVLLGEGREEEALLEELGVPPYRIFSVERDPKVFMSQSIRARSGELDIGLYFGDLREFIAHYLQTNQRILVLNLDICGAYRTSIDPVMTQILLFARRNPRTVIATYSNFSRDRVQLLEGLKSLAICQWLAPEATTLASELIFGNYLEAGLTPKVSLNMVLRHLFWIRSHLEHTVLCGVATGKVSAEQAKRLLNCFDDTWEACKNGFEGLPIRYAECIEVSRSLRRPTKQALLCDINIQAVTNVTYESAKFYHHGWFALYRRVNAMTPSEWLTRALYALTVEPFHFSDLDGKELISVARSEKIPDRQIVWEGDDIDTYLRHLGIPEVMPEWLGPDESVTEDTAPAPVAPMEHDDVLASIRKLGREGLNTDEVITRLGLTMPRASVTAYIANARRK